MARLDVTETFHHISFPGHIHTQDSLKCALHFQFQDSDTVIATYPKSGKDRTALSHLCSLSQHIRHAATLTNYSTSPSFTHFAVEENGQGFNNCICTDYSRLLYCHGWFYLSLINCFQDPLLSDHLSLWK